MCFCRTYNRKAPWLVEVGGKFGKKLVMTETDRHGDANILFNAVDQPHERLCGWAAMQTVSAAQIQKRLIDGKRFDKRRVLAHQIADLIAGLLIFLHVGPNNHGLRTQLFGLKHGHGRMHGRAM